MIARKRLIVKVPKRKLKLFVIKRTPKKELKPAPLPKKRKRAKITKYKIDLRSVDDKLIEAIYELDIIIDKAIAILIDYHSSYIVNHLLSQTYSKDIKPGGVRIFSGSRKKESIKLKIIDLISYITTPKSFIGMMNKLGLVRSAREKIITEFIQNFQKDWFLFLRHYGDPFPVYQKLYPIYIAYKQLKHHIIRITFTTLSRIVLSRYQGWTFRRVINSTGDFIDYQEDVQNSAFSINKALGLFDPKKNKSFFSYATRWIKEGISSSDFILNDSDLITYDELGNEVSVQFESMEDSNVVNIDEKNYVNYVNDLYQSDPSSDDDAIKVLDFFKGSFPVPNEVRILYRLLNLKNVNTE